MISMTMKRRRKMMTYLRKTNPKDKLQPNNNNNNKSSSNSSPRKNQRKP
jgi:hypothetical protein